MSQPARYVDNWELTLVEQLRNHGRWFFNLAYGVVRDSTAAEDACQQAFLKAWELKERIRNPAALKAWLAKVVINESLQLVRRRKAEAQARDRCAHKTNANISAPENIEFKELLQVTLDELPEQTRIIVVLRLIQGMSGKEVKTLLGCSGSEVSRRLHQGIEHLRVRFTDLYMKDQKMGQL